jgi:beta-lactamase regulating signal transducer with metallopeptidase domain
MIAPLYIHLAESTFFALAMAAAAFCMRRCSAAARYAVWFCGAVKFAVPAALFAQLGASLENLLPTRYSSLVHNATLPGIYPKFSAPSAGAEYRWLVPVVIGVWLSGVAILLGTWIRHSISAARSLEEADAAERSVLAELRQRTGLRQAVQLRYSARGKCELGLWGIWRPAIRIPRGFSSELTPAEFETVLLHELAHVRRWDNASGAFVHFVVCVFWFYPLLWWIERQLLIERERACAEFVIQSGAPTEIYVTGILKVCRFQVAEPAAGTSGMTHSNLQSRMESIMSYRPKNRILPTPHLLQAALAAVMIIVPFGGGFLHSAPAQNKAATAVLKKADQSFCKVQPSTSSRYCICQDGKYSLGAIVKTADDTFLRCDRFELGKFTAWRTATLRERGRK